MTTVHLELISDFICPWCYLGKVRLERVRQLVKDEIQLDIEVKPYVLYPHIPKGGLPKADFAKKTKPGMGRSLRHEAKVEGIEINYKNIERIPYSLEAHRLVWLIPDKEKKYELAKKIFHGYFEEGRDIEDHDYLTDLGKSIGVSQSIIGQFLFSDQGLAEVQTAIQQTKEEFISVVPSIKFDRKILLPGLQPVEVWENYVRRAAKIQNR
jgi:predicted DsbA family dithiol-disulfide isomerase